MPITLNTDKLTDNKSKKKPAASAANAQNTDNSIYFDEIIILSDHNTTVGKSAIETLRTLQYEARNIRTQKNSALKIRHFESAPDAIYHIVTQKDEKYHYAALILCDYVLDDFDAGLIISLLRLHPLGELFPVVVTLNTDLVDEHHREFWLSKNSWDDSTFWETEKLNLRTIGAAGFLQYPYCMQDILDCCNVFTEDFAKTEAKYYQNIISLEQTDPQQQEETDKTIKEQLKNFEEAFVRFFYTPEENASYEELFLIGKQKYYDRLYKQATICFEQSSENESAHQADSLTYLYAIHKEQNKQNTAKIYLERAFNAYVYDEDWEKARESASIFAKEFPEQKNPLFSSMQKHFAHANYQTINKIIENTRDIVPLQDIGDHLVQLNGSKKLPPAIVAFVEQDRELKEIIFESKLKETVLDGEAYIRQQEKEKTLQRLELQWKSRLSGEIEEKNFREKYAAKPIKSVEDLFNQTKPEKTVLNFELTYDTDTRILEKNPEKSTAKPETENNKNFNNSLEQALAKAKKRREETRSDHFAQNKLKNIKEEEKKAKEEEKTFKQHQKILENALQTRADARAEAEAKIKKELEIKLEETRNKKEAERAEKKDKQEQTASAPQNDRETQNNTDRRTEELLWQASKIGTKSKTSIDPIPTIMLDGGNGSFWGDIMNMAKFTKFISKNKKKK